MLFRSTGPSRVQSFAIGGTNLASDTVSVAWSTSNYEFSKDGVTFGAASPLIYLGSGGTLASSLVYVRLKAGLSTNATVTNRPVTISTRGATSVVDTLNGVVYTPTINTANPSTVTGISYNYGNGPSTEKTFTVSGTLSQPMEIGRAHV